MNPHLARIRLFPVKSLDGQEVSEAVVLRHAGLAHDREFCLLDEKGECLNTKRLGKRILGIRSQVDFVFGELKLSDGEDTETFHFDRDQKKIERWFRKRLGQKVQLAFDSQRGFPDDTNTPGPTLITTATLREVSSWLPGLSVEEVRRRFRANLEVDGVPAFWEDHLYATPGEVKPFRIGDVAIEGVNPCARCAVPSHDSVSGEVEEPAFAKILAERRRKTLPAWAEKKQFDHFYRLAVNTRIPESEAGKVLHALDPVLL